MNAVIYARYSSDNQREESIEGQLRECKDFAEKQGMNVIQSYIDRACSAKTDNRPAFQEMIRDSSKRGFEVVIVWKLDRFSRNRYDSARYKAALRKNGVKVISATEKISEGSEGIILESVLEGFAEYYSADLSEKVTRGMTENALKGKSNGSLTAGYTVDSDQNIIIDEKTAPFIQKTFEMYSKGEKIKDIVNYLNSYGIKNSRGKAMNYDSVRRILSNRRYIGEYSFNGAIGHIPAIVSNDLFDKVQSMLEKSRHMPRKGDTAEEYLLTTKLICGYCGSMMRGDSGTSASGTVYRYYKCASVKEHSQYCPQRAVSKDYIENLVINYLIDMLLDDATVEAITAAIDAYQNRQQNPELIMLKEQLSEITFRLSNLYANLELGISTPTILDRIRDLEASQKNTETRIKEEIRRNPILSRDQILLFLYDIRQADINNVKVKRALINTLLNRVVWYSDKLYLFINFKDQSKTIKLPIAECSDYIETGSPNHSLSERSPRLGAVHLKSLKRKDKSEKNAIS